MGEGKGDYTIRFPAYTQAGEVSTMTLKVAKRGHARIVQAALVSGGVPADQIAVTVNKTVDLTPKAPKAPAAPKTPKVKK